MLSEFVIQMAHIHGNEYQHGILHRVCITGLYAYCIKREDVCKIHQSD